MKAPVDTIGSHTGTGAGSGVSALGDAGTPGQGIASPIRHFHITGIAGGSIVKLQGSLDNSNWYDWLTNIAADGWFIVPDGPLYMRSNCTTFGSGTVTVKCQKFVEE